MLRFGYLGVILVACAACLCGRAGIAQGASTSDARTIVFIGLHGIVNGQIAIQPLVNA